jgi:hypothetical protein
MGQVNGLSVTSHLVTWLYPWSRGALKSSLNNPIRPARMDGLTRIFRAVRIESNQASSGLSSR